MVKPRIISDKKNLKILLISPPQGLSTEHIEAPKFQVHPLGLLYIAGVLEKSSYNVSILDAFSFGKSLEEIKNKIVDFMPDIVGITAMTLMACDAYEVAKTVKQINRATVVVMGGPHATAMHEEVLNIGDIDIAILGEGENCMLEICDSIEKKNDFNTIKGIVFKSNGMITKTDSRLKFDELDKIPFPAYHLLTDFKDYNPPPHWGKRGKFASIITSRGCPYDCSFCSVTRSWGKKYRYRSPENVISEIEYLNDNCGVSFLSFRDSIATLHKSRLIDICKGILEKGLKIRWNCNARTNEVDLELLSWMKRAGCKSIFYGIESGNEQILSQFKGLKKDDIRQAISITDKVGIEPHGFFMFGLPGETKESMSETIAFAKSLKLHTAGFTTVTPFPGSRLWDYSLDHNLLLTMDWNEYNLKGRPVSKYVNLSSDDILDAQKKAFREFYLRPKIIYYQLKNIKSFNDLASYVHEAIINLLKKRK